MTTEQINGECSPLEEHTNDEAIVENNEQYLGDTINGNNIKVSSDTIEESIIIPETSSDNNNSLSNQLHKYQTEIDRLNSSILSQTNEIDQLNSKLILQDQTYQQFVSKLKDDYHKEKQVQVVRYAQSEKRTLDLEKRCEQLTQKQTELQRDKDVLQQKLQESKSLNVRIQQAYDLKLSEISQLKKELDKLKETSQSVDQTLKLTLAHLKQETQKLREQKDLNEQIKRELNEEKETNEQLRKQYKEPSESQQQTVIQSLTSLSSNELQLSDNDIIDDTKKQQLDPYQILELKLDEKSEQCDQLTSDQNQLKVKITNLIEENLLLQSKIKLLEDDKLSLENVRETDILNTRKEKESNQKLYDNLLKLHEQDCVELTRLKMIEEDYIELKDDYEQYRNKKSELLEFTQKLTELNSVIQSDYEQLNSKYQSIEKQYKHINQLYKEQQMKKNELENELRTVKQDYDNSKLKYVELLHKYDICIKQYEDEKIENQSLRKKHQINNKDLIKQIQQLQKKSNDFSQSPTVINSRQNLLVRKENDDGGSSLGSRTSSSCSLNDQSSSINTTTIQDQITNEQQNNDSEEIVVNVFDIDRQKLIDKLLKQQKLLVRRNEKIEFLNDHIFVLTQDLQNKRKIIQAYAINEDISMYSLNTADNMKQELISKKNTSNSLMATLYTHATNPFHLLNGSGHKTSKQSEMTVETSDDIINRLQAALEETLLKNITLKENIDTLTKEIEQLNKS
ncbi:unnamed protein product [Didymodactylos carnosus]|uniref:Uncharacterized protein n=1 Tax=Didymodactylos carnosus TaxID=1234261 RepID=A0A814GPP8_9BILA|nr:unnamed protein product [Didymodactylos carnosus]CAF0999324.1 unnamed protein product [Didymodactylos carnosus]CAF3611825.1 unnamed protein product [Didymodactylos carnosus]CAF3770792.1 unnamed protein product [Didymodactylos carnosus]